MAAVRNSSIVNKRPWKALPFTIKLIQKALKFRTRATSCTSFHWNNLKTPTTFWFSQRGSHEYKKSKRAVTPIQ